MTGVEVLALLAHKVAAVFGGHGAAAGHVAGHVAGHAAVRGGWWAAGADEPATDGDDDADGDDWGVR